MLDGIIGKIGSLSRFFSFSCVKTLAFFSKREYHCSKTDLFGRRADRSQIPPWRAELVLRSLRRCLRSKAAERFRTAKTTVGKTNRRRVCRGFNGRDGFANVAVLSGGEKREFARPNEKTTFFSRGARRF